MSYIKREFTCRRDKLTIRGYEFLPEGANISGKEKLPCVVLSHGFRSCQKEMYHFAKHFVKWGYASYTFDFNGGGAKCKSDGKTTEMSVLTEREDLKSVIAHIQGLNYVDSSNLVLMGCSQGGFVSALVAAELKDEIRKLILFFPALCIPDDARAGDILGFSFDTQNIPKELPGKKITIGKKYLQDAMSLNPFEKIVPYSGSVLILHGTADAVVNSAYGKQAWLSYSTGETDVTVEKAALTSKAEMIPLPELPKEVSPNPSVQLALISGAGHGFYAYDYAPTIRMVELFLKGYVEVLTIDVRVTGRKMEHKGLNIHLELPFGGEAKSPYFNGTILPGACDRQEIFWMFAKSKCATYTLEGRDYTGELCKVHIVNKDNGKGFKPTVSTDSKALGFLNHTDCEAILHNRKSGPIVRIFARV